MKNVFNKPDLLFTIRDIIRETLMGNAILCLIISAVVYFTCKVNPSLLDFSFALFLSASGIFIFLWLAAITWSYFGKLTNTRTLSGVLLFMIWVIIAELVLTLTLLTIAGKPDLL
jgi:hypothetical protein